VLGLRLRYTVKPVGHDTKTDDADGADQRDDNSVIGNGGNGDNDDSYSDLNSGDGPSISDLNGGDGPDKSTMETAPTVWTSTVEMALCSIRTVSLMIFLAQNHKVSLTSSKSGPSVVLIVQFRRCLNRDRWLGEAKRRNVGASSEAQSPLTEGLMASSSSRAS
jgi:hypothetical protein